MLNIRSLDAAGYFFVHVEEGVEERSAWGGEISGTAGPV